MGIGEFPVHGWEVNVAECGRGTLRARGGIGKVLLQLKDLEALQWRNQSCYTDNTNILEGVSLCLRAQQRLHLPSSSQCTTKSVHFLMNELLFERENVISTKATSTRWQRTDRAATLPTVTPANAIQPLVHGRPQRNGHG